MITAPCDEVDNREGEGEVKVKCWEGSTAFQPGDHVTPIALPPQSIQVEGAGVTHGGAPVPSDAGKVCISSDSQSASAGSGTGGM